MKVLVRFLLKRDSTQRIYSSNSTYPTSPSFPVKFARSITHHLELDFGSKSRLLRKKGVFYGTNSCSKHRLDPVS